MRAVLSDSELFVAVMALAACRVTVAKLWRTGIGEIFISWPFSRLLFRTGLSDSLAPSWSSKQGLLGHVKSMEDDRAIGSYVPATSERGVPKPCSLNEH
jgi:hypothetical protein